jgi:hypothetical protein
MSAATAHRVAASFQFNAFYIWGIPMARSISCATILLLAIAINPLNATDQATTLEAPLTAAAAPSAKAFSLEWLPNVQFSYRNITKEQTPEGTVVTIDTPRINGKIEQAEDSTSSMFLPSAATTFEAYLAGPLTLKINGDRTQWTATSDSPIHLIVQLPPSAQPVHIVATGKFHKEVNGDISALTTMVATPEAATEALWHLLTGVKSSHSDLTNFSVSALTPEAHPFIKIASSAIDYQVTPTADQRQELSLTAKSDSSNIYSSSLAILTQNSYPFIAFDVQEVNPAKYSTAIKVTTPTWQELARSVHTFITTKRLPEIRGTTTLAMETQIDKLSGDLTFHIGNSGDNRQQVQTAGKMHYAMTLEGAEKYRQGLIKGIEAASSQLPGNSSAEKIDKLSPFDDMVYHLLINPAFGQLLKLLPLDTNNQWDINFDYQPGAPLAAFNLSGQIASLTPEDRGVSLEIKAQPTGSDHLSITLHDQQVVFETGFALYRHALELSKRAFPLADLLRLSGIQEKALVALLRQYGTTSGNNDRNLTITISHDNSGHEFTVSGNDGNQFLSELFGLFSSGHAIEAAR